MLTSLSAVIGHRGARAYAPENTLSSILTAAQQGVQWVEFDVMLAKCGTPIVIHDQRVNRTTNGKGEVAELTYAQIRKLDAGAWFNAKFAGEHVPSLVEMIEFLARHNLAANVEIKPYPDQDVATALKALEIIHAHWPSHLPAPLISSFSLESLFAIRQVNNQLPLGLLLDKWRNDWAEIAFNLNCLSLHLHYRLVNKKRVAEIKDQGYKVLVYTVNELAKAQKFWSWGVDAVFTDYPDKLLNQSKR